MSALPVASEIAARLLAAKGVEPDPAFASPVGEHPLEISPNLLDSLRLAATKAYWEASSRTAFWAGVLKGSWEGGRLHIRDFESLGEFESAEALAAQLDARSEESVEWVGWFRTKLGRDARMMDSDVALFEKYFPESHQTTLILRPSSQRPLLAAFYFRNEAGVVRPSRPEQEMVLVEPRLAVGDEPRQPEFAAEKPRAVTPIRLPVKLDEADRTMDAFPGMVRLMEEQGKRAWLKWSVATLALGVLGLAGWQNRGVFKPVMDLVAPSRTVAATAPAAAPAVVAPRAELRVAASDARHWELAWSRQWLDQKPFTTGVVAVTQGGKTSTYALTAAQLMLGGLTVPRTAEDITVNLSVEAPGQPVLEERVQVVSQLERMVPAAQLRSEQERNARLAQELENMRRQVSAQR